ncbi:hypothetical protein [Zavarzinella formosa]|uniref:hypothetical protein n=1 Tax=Zavarzinella formosa TaxID=360055 RepID=UPI00030CC7A4|nr:hypothetical protein [Zavarzinella formosa]
MTADGDDVRMEFDPAEWIPDWFWDRIHQGGQDRARFQEVCRQMERGELAELIYKFDELTNIFINPPFRPPFPSLEAWLEDTAHWVLSQGKEFFDQVWQNPALFWTLKNDNMSVTQAEQGYQGIPELVWTERFPGEDIPGHRQDE